MRHISEILASLFTLKAVPPASPVVPVVQFDKEELQSIAQAVEELSLYVNGQWSLRDTRSEENSDTLMILETGSNTSVLLIKSVERSSDGAQVYYRLEQSTVPSIIDDDFVPRDCQTHHSLKIALESLPGFAKNTMEKQYVTHTGAPVFAKT